jgi:hypothetical protein
MSRRVEKRIKRQWIPVDFMSLTSGCTFRMFEDDGTPVRDASGQEQFIAAGKPYLNEQEVPTIKTYDQVVLKQRQDAHRHSKRVQQPSNTSAPTDTEETPTGTTETVD